MKKSIIFLGAIFLMSLTNCGHTSSNHTSADDNRDLDESDYVSHRNSNSNDNEDSRTYSPAIKLKVTNIDDGAKVLDNQAGNSYHAKNMFDDNPSTGWSIKLSDTQAESGRIYGPSMNVNARKLDHIVIQNGYGKSHDSFQKNTRAKRIQIYRVTDKKFPDKKDIIYEGPLKDIMEPQILKVSPRYDNTKPTGIVQITFPTYSKENYYMGSKWDDLVISELEFYGKPSGSHISTSSK